MGQQQMLLIVLGIIIVGLASYTSLRLANSYNMDQNRDQLILQINSIDAYAEQYALKSKALGGGAGQFINFTLPVTMQQTPAGTFRVSAVTSSSLQVLAVGNVTGYNGIGPVGVNGTVVKGKNLIAFIVN